ncbi:MAG: glycosyltransferase family 9 protein [Candidatus Brocadia sp. WS118]|nr:MAG: glycosyltransferase family 9 protein [Candidatus Brocadia sp. WS118]
MMPKEFDCRFFASEKPCRFKLDCSVDDTCPQYQSMGKRILIIKLAAIGDVLRTTPILPVLKEKYPHSQITWITDSSSLSVLEENPFIDRLLTANYENALRLQVEKFDVLICLDKDTVAASLASLVKAEQKLGFALSEKGHLYPLNKEADYLFRLGVSDELKFWQNKKTYQQLIFEALGLGEKYGEYVINLPRKYTSYGEQLVKQWGISNGRLTIGLNTGAGKRFATKRWEIGGFVELADRLSNDLKAHVVLLGGPEEIERNKEIASRTKFPVIDSGCHHSLKEFMGLIHQCHLIVTGDTLALHLAIALKKLVVTFFGSTCHQEIDLYGRGQKLIAGVDCAPCYKGSCDTMICMKRINADGVFHACKEVLHINGLLKR